MISSKKGGNAWNTDQLRDRFPDEIACRTLLRLLFGGIIVFVPPAKAKSHISFLPHPAGPVIMSQDDVAAASIYFCLTPVLQANNLKA